MNTPYENSNYIYSPGTQVVLLRDVIGPNQKVLEPRGAVGVVVRSPRDWEHAYRVRFPDGVEQTLKPADITILSHYKTGSIGDDRLTTRQGDLYDRVIFRCIIGSRAYGLEDENSDTDYRGIYLPPAELQWSMYGVPEQLECHETQEAYWELQKFLTLALKANPNVLECLYSPLVEHATPLAKELLEMRERFLSRMVYQTFNGYVLSQFKKMQTDIRNQGQVKWKHVMHLLRLLMSGIGVLTTGIIPVRVDEHRDQLLAVKRGDVPWKDTEAWRKELHAQFEEAFRETDLPERPDYDAANAFLIRARRLALEEDLP